MLSSHGIFLIAAVALLLVLERWSPWRREKAPTGERWLSNIGLMLLGSLTGAFLLAGDLMTVAGEMPGGALRDQRLPLWAEGLVVVVLLDGWRYWEHRILHEVPLLWRVHLVHHSDTALDVTTAERHHPLEVVLVVFTGMLLLFALGYSAQALGIYIVLATVSSLVTHASIRLPEKVDRSLRLLLVTPAVHAVHHSDLQSETDSNYGTLFTVWDRLFGTYVDPANARLPHYGLEYFHRREDTGFGAVLAQPFLYRRDMGFYPPRADIAQGAEVGRRAMSLSSAWRRALQRLGISLALCGLVLWPTGYSLAQVWAAAETYQYAWWILPVMLYVVAWHNRENTLALVPAADNAGVWFILPAIALWGAGFIADIQLVQHIALVLFLQGILLCSLGRVVYRALFPVFAMLFLMIPSGDVLQLPLRDLTVTWIEWFALVFDIPHRIEGYVTYIGEFRYVVIDACSGLTYVLMGGFLGYSFGLLLFPSLWNVLGMALAGAALGVLTNALRVWLILGVDWLSNAQMDIDAHTDIQWLALLISLGALVYLASLFADRGSAPRKPAAWQPKTVLASAIAPQPGLMASVLPVALVVATLGTVQALAGSFPQGVRSIDSLLARYPGSHVLEEAPGAQRALAIPYARGIEAVLVEPSRSYGRVPDRILYPEDLGIWRHAGTGRFTDCVGGECVDFVHKVFRRKASDQARHVVYAYFVGASVTSSQLDYRLSGGLNRLLGEGVAAGALGFRVAGEMPRNSVLAEAFLRIHADINAIGPHLPLGAVLPLRHSGGLPSLP